MQRSNNGDGDGEDCSRIKRMGPSAMNEWKGGWWRERGELNFMQNFSFAIQIGHSFIQAFNITQAREGRGVTHRRSVRVPAI